MNKIAIIEPKPSKNDYYELFEGKFEFELYQLCSDKTKKKILVKDVDIEINIEDFKWVILIGSEPTKKYTKKTSVTEYSGKVLDGKFIPCINPAMLAFNPGAKGLWDDSKNSITKYVTGQVKTIEESDLITLGIIEEKEAIKYLKEAINSKTGYISLDCETSALYPREGYVLGLSLCWKKDLGIYISSECITEEVEKLLQKLFDKKIVVFQNAKFDIKFLGYHFGFKFPRFDDTMLMHYTLDETPGTHGLKSLALRFTTLGDYDQPLKDFIVEYCKEYGIKKADFSYELIPFEIMVPYACIDAVCTFILYKIFKTAIRKNSKLVGAYQNILIPAVSFLIDVEENGMPFDLKRLLKSQKLMMEDILKAKETLYAYSDVQRFMEINGEFNPNSPVQLRKLLFDFLGLDPIPGKLTGTGQFSTDAEVLKLLADEHPVPLLILEVRQKSKIKNTYLDKIIIALDSDSRLRTNYNLHVTTSGRLSSSGKLNAQQLPRDNPIIKGCIKARPGYKIISMDLKTAEMYIAAVLSKDKALTKIFKDGVDMHSATAKEVFRLKGDTKDIATLYPEQRQATKAINFGIIYGAQAFTVCQSIYKDTGRIVPHHEMEIIIGKYFQRFYGLKKWIDDNINYIKANGFIYSHFGRKRRLPNVKSSNRATASHEVRSGLNFLIQSVASDVNLLAGIDMNNWLKHSNIDALIFGLVHDSILAEVKESDITEYCTKLKEYVQQDRGMSIPGSPIGCDFEVGDDYSFGKYEKVYMEAA